MTNLKSERQNRSAARRRLHVLGLLVLVSLPLQGSVQLSSAAAPKTVQLDEVPRATTRAVGEAKVSLKLKKKRIPPISVRG